MHPPSLPSEQNHDHTSVRPATRHMTERPRAMIDCGGVDVKQRELAA